MGKIIQSTISSCLAAKSRKLNHGFFVSVGLKMLQSKPFLEFGNSSWSHPPNYSVKKSHPNNVSVNEVPQADGATLSCSLTAYP